MTTTRGSRRANVLAAALLAAGVLGTSTPALAVLSGAANSTTGFSCSGGSNADGDCRNSVSFTAACGPSCSTFSSRYAWNINADLGIFATRDESGTARHNISFTATAPGGYRLDISTSRVGAMGRSEDAFNCDGSSDTSGVTGSSNVAIAGDGGTLSTGDPGVIGNGGGKTSTPYSNAASARIFRVSNGAGQSHSLSFTWSGAVRSNSCEASVRQGETQGMTTGCPTCEYPGDPSRTQNSDGHFVTVTFTSLCGNGSVDGSVSEQCDQGSANGSFGSCCTSTCLFQTAGTTCRNSAGACDPAETCTGSSSVCPADALSPAGTTCRASAGVCDLTETCTGTGVNCPPDAKSTAVCRPAAGACDLAESCTGIADDCPPDIFQPPGAICRLAFGACDEVEDCTGANPTCPPDAVLPAGTVCRAAVGTCDVAETCDGSSPACPADAFEPSSVECRASAGVCDVAENCTGSSGNCPADAFEPSSVECRAATGDCDVAENCTGSNANCPADSVAGAFTECRPAAGVCDQAENCDGATKNCPADAFVAANVQCRAAAGTCDVAEACTGTGPNCPADAFEPSSVQCRASAGACDVAENCTGSGAACPADALQPGGTQCRAAVGDCDVAESCTGLSTACPPDLSLPDNTPCDDGSSCTVNDVCTGGVCGGTPTLDTCLDDFLCDKAKPSAGQPKFIPTSVILDDQFENQTFLVRKPKYLCPPADKHDGNGTVDPATHLAGYSIKSITGSHIRRFNIQVDNQIGTIRLDTVRPDLLLVPTAKNLLSQPPEPNPNTHNVDHYKCYKVKVTSGTPKLPKGTSVQESDQFRAQAQLLLKKPKHLCTPVDKNGEGIKNAATHLLCYSAKSLVKFQRQTGIFVTNQLQATRMDALKASEFCIPSTKTLSP